MPINTRPILVYDFETSGVDPYTCLPFELGCIAIDPQTFEIIENGVFCSKMGHSEEDLNALDQGKLNSALKVNNLKREDILTAPSEQVVFKEFASFVKRFNPSGKDFTRPIPSGFNIDGYDSIIIDRLCKKYGYVDKEGRQGLFYRVSLDMYKEIFWWLDTLKDPEYIGMDKLRDYFKIPKDGAHTATKDCYDTIWLIQRFNGMKRKIIQKNDRVGRLRGAYANQEA
jgi:hypothetical protein